MLATKRRRLAAVAAIQTALNSVSKHEEHQRVLSGYVASLERDWRANLAVFVEESGLDNDDVRQELLTLPIVAAGNYENLPALVQLTKDTEIERSVGSDVGIAAAVIGLVPFLLPLTVVGAVASAKMRKKANRLDNLYQRIIANHAVWGPQYVEACSELRNASTMLSNARSEVRYALDKVTPNKLSMDLASLEVLAEQIDFAKAKTNLRFSLLGRRRGLEQTDSNIALVGDAGMGKSTTVCCILDVDPAEERGDLERPFVYDGTEAGTNEPEEFRADSFGAVFWDMPGIGPGQPRSEYFERLLSSRPERI